MRYLLFILVFVISASLNAYEPDSLYNKELNEVIMQRAAQNILKYRKGQYVLTIKDDNGNAIKNTNVHIKLVKHQFYFGNILQPLVMQPQNVDDPEKYKQQFTQFHNFAVVPFYWGFYEAQPGKTMDKNYPEILKWAKKENITLKGHPLAWGSRSHLPKWLFSIDKDSSEQRLLQRIEDITRRYKGSIDIWDVVNEPTHTSPWSRSMDTTKYHITDLSLDELSEIIDWTEKCFWAAHRGNPKATFILNDYETIYNPDNQTAFYYIVKELLRRGVPIHAIGIQAHNPKDCWYPPDLFLSALNLYSKLGLPIHITEFHPLSKGEPITGGWMKGTWDEEAQAEFASMMLTLAFSHPSVVSFTSWGLTDKFIWRDGAGYFDSEYSPKPVARRFNDYINHIWNFSESLTTDENGTIKLDAFYGDYELILRDEIIPFKLKSTTTKITLEIQN